MTDDDKKPPNVEEYFWHRSERDKGEPVDIASDLLKRSGMRDHRFVQYSEQFRAEQRLEHTNDKGAAYIENEIGKHAAELRQNGFQGPDNELAFKARQDVVGRENAEFDRIIKLEERRTWAQHDAIYAKLELLEKIKNPVFRRVAEANIKHRAGRMFDEHERQSSQQATTKPPSRTFDVAQDGPEVSHDNSNDWDRDR